MEGDGATAGDLRSVTTGSHVQFPSTAYKLADVERLVSATFVIGCRGCVGTLGNLTMATHCHVAFKGRL